MWLTSNKRQVCLQRRDSRRERSVAFRGGGAWWGLVMSPYCFQPFWLTIPCGRSLNDEQLINSLPPFKCSLIYDSRLHQRINGGERLKIMIQIKKNLQTNMVQLWRTRHPDRHLHKYLYISYIPIASLWEPPCLVKVYIFQTSLVCNFFTL